MSDIYLSLTETPSVVTLSQPVIATQVAATVTVGNTVTVALDANSLSALEQVTVTVGAAVSVSNFPATQTIAGTVTANVVGTRTFVDVNAVTVSGFLAVGGWDDVNSQHAPIPLTDSGTGVKISYDDANGTPLQVVNFPATPFLATVTVGNSVTIGSLPAISGTVTAYAVGRYAISGNTFQDKNIATDANGQTLINAIVNALFIMMICFRGLDGNVSNN